MRLTVKSDYAIRALAELAARAQDGTPMTAEEIAEAQGIPRRFLLGIMSELRRDHLVVSHRGVNGGYVLGQPPCEITLADVIRSVEGPLAEIGDDRPGEITYTGAAALLTDVWIAVRASLRSVLEEVTLANLATGKLPPTVDKLTRDPDAWQPH
jgi:Rrf2 family protein